MFIRILVFFVFISCVSLIGTGCQKKENTAEPDRSVTRTVPGQEQLDPDEPAPVPKGTPEY